MGKVFFLVWLTFNPNHTANLSYMGGHEYASAAQCNAISARFNGEAEKAMMLLSEEEFPETEYGCTTIAPTHWGKPVIVDIESIADDTDFFIKAD